MNGQELTFDVAGNPARGYLAVPEQLPAPGVIVLHAWWGLNPFFRSLCDRLAAEGFAAFAPDMNDGKVAVTVDEAGQMMADSDPQRKQAIVAAAPAVLHGRAEVTSEGFSLLGFSMGAARSLSLAAEEPDSIGRLVLFYGIADAEFSKIRTEILGHFAGKDEWEPLDSLRLLEAEMRTTGLNPTFHLYPDAQHWFFEEDRPEFSPQAAGLAWTRTLEFLRR